jgi:hypothetical protein
MRTMRCLEVPKECSVHNSKEPARSATTFRPNVISVVLVLSTKL